MSQNERTLRGYNEIVKAVRWVELAFRDAQSDPSSNVAKELRAIARLHRDMLLATGRGYRQVFRALEIQDNLLVMNLGLDGYVNNSPLTQTERRR